MYAHAHVEDLRTLGEEMRNLLDESDSLDENDRERLADLRNLAEQLGTDDLESYGDNYEPTLILASTFEEYARELAEDIGAITGEETWPLNCIDWEHAARELAYDYTTVTFEGTDWKIRSV